LGKEKSVTGMSRRVRLKLVIDGEVVIWKCEAAAQNSLSIFTLNGTERG
jgi:hypothetical protein